MRDDLDFSDIPFEDDSEESSESSESSSNSTTSNYEGVWFINHLTIQSKKFNLFLDLFKLKTIKELIYILSVFEEKSKTSKIEFAFMELLSLINRVMKQYFNKTLSEVLKMEVKTYIDWKNYAFVYQDEQKIEVKVNESKEREVEEMEKDEQIVSLKIKSKT